nr:COP1-interacting protein 7-like [Tanacetum cinerariifolium]
MVLMLPSDSARQWHVHESEVVEVVADQGWSSTCPRNKKISASKRASEVYARALVAGFVTDDLTRSMSNGSVDCATDSSTGHGSHFHPYMQTYQASPTFQPPYQGYPFPGMVVPPYYQGNLPWPQNVEDSKQEEHYVLMVSKSNLNKKKDEATCINEPSDLYMVLERDTSCQETMAAWNPEMESESSNQKIVILDFVADDKSTKSSTKTLVGKGLERKGTITEAKSNALFGSRSKKSIATKMTILKEKSEKKSTQRAFSGSNPDSIKKDPETQHGKVTIFRNEVQE